MKQHTFHPAADAEYTEAARYYAKIGPELAGRFYDDVEEIIRQLRTQPERFRRVSPLVRRALCENFPYAVLFVDEPDRILIVTVMHAMRRPGYWRSRLR